ncbi:MAG: SDR family oxidoreductase [bacterium]|nr:SDR family oxidoreductase [bacterium]
MKTPLSGPIDLAGKVALVTGASQGIGRASCLALGREGARIAACDIQSSVQTAHAVNSLDREVLDFACDIRDKASIEKTVAKIIDIWGRLDILVNNAGILGKSALRFKDYTAEDWDIVLQTNLRGTFLMSQSVWPHMQKQQSGKIICMGSIAGKIGGILAGAHYSASKGGIHSFVKWAAKRGAQYGIYVNGIAPGPIETPMTVDEPYKDEMVPLGRLGQPEDVAEVVVFLASQASNFITGSIIDANGGMSMN